MSNKQFKRTKSGKSTEQIRYDMGEVSKAKQAKEAKYREKARVIADVLYKHDWISEQGLVPDVNLPYYFTAHYTRYRLEAVIKINLDEYGDIGYVNIFVAEAGAPSGALEATFKHPLFTEAQIIKLSVNLLEAL